MLPRDGIDQKNACALPLPLGEIQEAIFEEKIFRIFFTKNKEVLIATNYKTGLYLDLPLENRIYVRNDDHTKETLE
jgi:hypothetical protein